MYRETTFNNEIHVSHHLSKRFRVKRDDRIWDHVSDLYSTGRIEMRCENKRGVQ
ncbi:MAG: hypothetical protein JW807_03100 [Spirochaetes bacterium]|nr:hypothetical protein [Spirochaetota bacterium]